MGIFSKERDPSVKRHLLCKVCLSAAKSHSAGGARPVSDSLIPRNKESIILNTQS